MRLFEGGGPRGAFAVFCLGLALCRAEAVHASTFRVSPVLVNLSTSSPSTLLTVSNHGDEPLRFQVSAFAWDEDAEGKMRLTPTQDVVFFPMMLTLAPGEERKVRVGSTAKPGDIEKSYRVYVEELPPPPGVETRGQGTQIRVLTKMGLPVFVQPVRPEPATSVEIVGLVDDRLKFLVRNTGNTHVMLHDVHIQGTDTAGGLVVDRKVEGWYLLPGHERAFDEAISADECAALTGISIDADTDRGRWTAQRELPAPACGQSAARAASAKSE